MYICLMRYFYLIITILFLSSFTPTVVESCTDGLLNQNETDIDCGGDCVLCEITYPNTANYGVNVLDSITQVFEDNIDYSFACDLPIATSVIVEIIGDTMQGTSSWFYDGATVDGWIISDVTNKTQTFTSNKFGDLDLKFEFLGVGNGVINIYENNSSVITRSKTFNW